MIEPFTALEVVMKIALVRKLRFVMLLLIALSTFAVGVTAFYFYAEAAAFLFQPKQSAPETTQKLTPKAATPPIFEFAPTPMPYQTKDNWQPVCENCVQ